MNKWPSRDKKHEIKNNINTVLKTSVCPPDCGSIILDIDKPAVEAIFSPATAAAENIMVKISPTDNPIPISDNIMINRLNPGIDWISGTLITGNKKAVKLMPTIILTCKGIPPKEKKGALIKNEEMRKDAIKKITKYWYKLNKSIPGKLRAVVFIKLTF